MNLHRPSRQTLSNALSILAGNLVYSLTVAAFLMPAGLVTGGATGIALAVNRLTGLSASGVLLAVNLAMLALGWAVMGRSFALNTMASSLISPAALELWQRLLAGRVLTDDILLCTVFSGLGIGFSLGLVLLMVITYTLTLTERDVARVTRMESRPFKLPAKALADAEPETPATGAPVEAEEEPRELSLEEKVQLLALRNDISGRAYDVMLLMAKGRTAARIEQELYVSRGTVNTYSHKVYQKLGIHSRQELFDLVDNMKDE